MFRLAMDDLTSARRSLAVRGRAFQQVDGIVDGGERVPQFVGEDSQKLVPPFVGLTKLRVGFAECVLGGLALGNVEDEGYGPLALGLQEDVTHLDRHPGAVGSDIVLLVGLAPSGGAGLCEGGVVEREVLWRRDVRPAQPAGQRVLARSPDDTASSSLQS